MEYSQINLIGLRYRKRSKRIFGNKFRYQTILLKKTASNTCEDSEFKTKEVSDTFYLGKLVLPSIMLNLAFLICFLFCKKELNFDFSI